MYINATWPRFHEPETMYKVHYYVQSLQCYITISPTYECKLLYMK